MPCPVCGASVARAQRGEHLCDEERRVDYELFQLRGEKAVFDAQLGAYLDSPHGRFELYYAARERARPR